MYERGEEGCGHIYLSGSGPLREPCRYTTKHNCGVMKTRFGGWSIFLPGLHRNFRVQGKCGFLAQLHSAKQGQLTEDDLGGGCSFQIEGGQEEASCGWMCMEGIGGKLRLNSWWRVRGEVSTLSKTEAI